MSPAVFLFAALFAAEPPAGPAPAQKANPQVELQTSMGSIVIELYPDKAPKTVASFLAYVRSGQYDGTIFHRVIPRFMVQGGGFTADMTQKPTQPSIQNEADNGLVNSRGTLAMARTGDPHSATCQFFINTVDNGFLNFKSKTPQGWGYTVFAKVISGMDVVDKISGVATGTKSGFQDVPTQTVTIVKATVKP